MKTKTPSKLERILAAGHLAVTSECGPPRGSDIEEVVHKAELIKDHVDAINITDNQTSVTRLCSLASCIRLKLMGLEPVLQMVTRDRNRIALQSDLMGAAALGIANLLILRGDDPSAGDQPDAKGVFDLDARGLLETARKLRDTNELPSGRKVAGTAAFFLGAADAPIDPPPGWEPKSLAGKVAGGAQFAQTQFCMDPDVVARYTARLAEHGLVGQGSGDLKLIVGIAPLRSAKSARWMREKLFGTIIPDATVARLEAAADPAAEGRSIAVDLIAALAENPRVAGVHIMAPNNDEAVPAVIHGARARIKR